MGRATQPTGPRTLIAPDHEYDEYVPADGFESEAFDAW
jgi:hypothetical protein